MEISLVMAPSNYLKRSSPGGGHSGIALVHICLAQYEKVTAAAESLVSF